MTDKPQSPVVVPLRGGADARCEALLEAIRAVIYERAMGMPIPSILGVLRLVEHAILEEQS